MKDIYQEDFDYLHNALKKHPSLHESGKMLAYEQLALSLQNKIQDYDTLIDGMMTLTMFFEDGHTNIELPYTNEDFCIEIICEWQGDRLVLTEDYEDIEAGSEIVAIEGMKMDKVLEYAASVIPHENIYLVKSRMIEYPYMNYHVFSKMNLSRLFGEKSNYEITFKKEGKEFTKNCELVRYDGFIDFQEKDTVRYEIQGNRAILHLDGCVFDDEYKRALERLAVLCAERKSELLELDLSKNMGGSSAVIDEFIRYVDVDNFRRYEMIDYSGGSPQVISSRKEMICNRKQEVFFPKKIICRVSNTTFSSARTFAVTLKDNGIATIVGGPTGGKPCSYGLPLRDVTPNCKIKFRVSRCLFLRPDERLDEENALFPDGNE